MLRSMGEWKAARIKKRGTLVTVRTAEEPVCCSALKECERWYDSGLGTLNWRSDVVKSV